MLIPQDVKDEAIRVFLELTAELDAASFQNLVNVNASVWHELLDDNTRASMRVMAADAGSIVNLFDEGLVLNWIVDARPDLREVFLVTEARQWLARQIAEIRGQVTCIG